jgi:hypothetical protein
MADAAGGIVVHNPNKGAAKRAPLAGPSSYVEFRVHVAAGVPYRLWMRLLAQNDDYANDSLTLQFSNAVAADGLTAVAPIGSTQGLAVILEEGRGAGVSGWGWNDQDWGGSAQPVYFAQTGVTTIRIQQREDGVMWDQLILSSARYLTSRPGAVSNDHTLVDPGLGTSSGEIARHVYPRAGVFPVTLTVTDDDGARGAAETTAAIGGATTSLVARAGGPYTATAGTPVSFDATGSSVPPGASAAYEWSFGDQIVLRASAFRIAGTRWGLIADTSAAGGSALVNPNAGQSKPSSTTIAAPASYAEATFRAAAGVPYRIWLRLRAQNDDWNNDSVYVQFSGSTTSSGSGAWRIGTSQALSIILEEGRDAGVSGWGWNDNSYGSLGEPVYFNSDGLQTIRIQQREDGVRIDQVVITAGAHFDDRPGLEQRDGTILPLVAADAAGARTQHAYRLPGVYPVGLTVRAGSGVARDTTTVAVK